MEKNTNDHDTHERGGLGVEQALGVFDRIFGDSSPIVWKAAIFYALWIGLSHTAMTNATATELAQLSAIAYWFGWLFLAMTVVVGAFVGFTGWLDQRRFTAHSSKY